MELTTSAFVSTGEGKIITAHTVNEIREALKNLPQKTIIFMDVDDTLITPQSTLFRASSSFRFLIDDLKKNKKKYKNFETILSHWRLQRKVMLVSDEWPDFIRSLKKRYLVYALTKMESGPLGDIPSMERWRYDELNAKGISFTPNYNGTSENVLVSHPSKSSPATFYKGIFITGSFNKGEVLKAYFKNQQPSQIVLIDDRSEYLSDAIDECNWGHIPFLGILYRGIDLIPGTSDPKVAAFQKEYLFEHAKWLEDEEAEKLMSSQA